MWTTRELQDIEGFSAQNVSMQRLLYAKAIQNSLAIKSSQILYVKSFNNFICICWFSSSQCPQNLKEIAGKVFIEAEPECCPPEVGTCIMVPTTLLGGIPISRTHDFSNLSISWTSQFFSWPIFNFLWTSRKWDSTVRHSFLIISNHLPKPKIHVHVPTFREN